MVRISRILSSWVNFRVKKSRNHTAQASTRKFLSVLHSPTPPKCMKNTTISRKWKSKSKQNAALKAKYYRYYRFSVHHVRLQRRKELLWKVFCEHFFLALFLAMKSYWQNLAFVRSLYSSSKESLQARIQVCNRQTTKDQGLIRIRCIRKKLDEENAKTNVHHLWKET